MFNALSSHVVANPSTSVGISAGLGFLAGLTIFQAGIVTCRTASGCTNYYRRSS